METDKIIESIKQSGGASLNLKTGELNPTQGYFVSIADSEQTFKALTNENIDSYIKANADLLHNDGVFLGAWLHQGNVYLDCSECINDLENAIYKGIKRGQLAIYDAGRGETIYIPSAQKTGTSAQRETYARMTASQFAINYKSKIK